MAGGDLGEAGAQQEQAVYYNWPFILHLLPQLGWLVILPLFALRDNRRAGAWLVLLPLALVNLMLLLLRHLASGWYGDFGSYLGSLFGWLVFGLAALWLLLPLLSRTGRAGAFFLGLAVVEIAGGLVAILSTGTSFFLFLMPYGVAALAAMLALLLAAVFCRRRYSPGRFLGRLLGAAVGAVFLIALPFLTLGLIVMAFSGDLLEALSELLTTGIAFILGAGLALWLLLLPFLVLAFCSRCYRDRFHHAFRLPGMAMAVPPLPNRASAR